MDSTSNPIASADYDEDDIVDVLSVAEDRIHGCYRYVLEPITLVFISSISFVENLVPNIIELQYCRTVLNISKEECFNHTNKYETDIQTVTSTFLMMETFIKVLLPAAATSFVGPWSDTYGRKPLILASCLGYVVSNLLWTWLTSTSLHPLLFLLAYVPVGLTGGTSLFELASSCYICDIIEPESRTVRLAILHGLYWVTHAIALLVTRFAAKLDSYTTLFAAMTIICFLCLVYCWFCIPESVSHRPQLYVESGKGRNPFNFAYVYEMFESLFYKLNSDVRATVILLTMATVFNLISGLGENGILYLYLQHILNWNLAEFTPLRFTNYSVIIISTFCGIWFFCQWLKVSELYLLFIITYLGVAGYLILTYTKDVPLIYLAVVISSFTGVIQPLITSYLSKLIPSDEFGKIFSLRSLISAPTPVLASFIYTMLYNKTIDEFPSAIFLLSAAILLLSLYILLICFLQSPIHEDRFKVQICSNSRQQV